MRTRSIRRKTRRYIAARYTLVMITIISDNNTKTSDSDIATMLSTRRPGSLNHLCVHEAEIGGHWPQASEASRPRSAQQHIHALTEVALSRPPGSLTTRISPSFAPRAHNRCKCSHRLNRGSGVCANMRIHSCLREHQFYRFVHPSTNLHTHTHASARAHMHICMCTYMSRRGTADWPTRATTADTIEDTMRECNCVERLLGNA
eukprot:GHVU01167751.1.p1 GENE.GHVU01167751.1~~GHVU01167751.1.p1  ORF type:complete len:204 (-),score=5.04 GHVU01167751.1:176-787(-)